jgi:uncharacterized protein
VALQEAADNVSAMNSPERPLAVVTGASSGIGEAFAKALAAKGCDLVLVARRKERLDALAASLAAEHGAKAEVHVADLSQPADLDALVDKLRSGRAPRWLINNAGFGAHAATHDVPVERLRAMLRLNAEAVLVLSREIGAEMAKQGGGYLVNVASTAAFQSLPWFGVYGATKSFVLHLSEALHVELKGRVTVTALCPGYTRTEFVGSANLDGRFDRFPKMRAEDVAAAAIRAAERGCSLCIPGWHNRLQTWASSKFPRSWVLWTSTKLFRRRTPPTECADARIDA